MQLKSIHYYTSIIIVVFILLHLFNHLSAIFGVDVHIQIMNYGRTIYRNSVAEIILLLAIAIQIFSGIKLFIQKRKLVITFYDKVQIYSGLYLALFFVIHISAILAGRYIFKLNTNIYFGVAGLNTFPFNIFFIPYYFLAILSFFSHIAAIHHTKMKLTILGFNNTQQANSILALGIVLAILIMAALTNFCRGIEIPEAYEVILGK